MSFKSSRSSRSRVVASVGGDGGDGGGDPGRVLARCHLIRANDPWALGTFLVSWTSWTVSFGMDNDEADDESPTMSRRR